MAWSFLVFIRHCEEQSDEAIQFLLPGFLDCFASLAMTILILATDLSHAGKGEIPIPAPGSESG
jgi:hypothetical protein